MSARNNLAPTGRIFVEFYIQYFVVKYVKKIQVCLEPDKNSSTWRENLLTFMIIHEVKNASNTSCRENKNIFRVKYIVSENRAAFETITKNTTQPDGPWNT